MTESVAVVTLARGRRAHLARQAAAVSRQIPPERYVVVDLGGPPVGFPADVLLMPTASGGDLPLSAARNAGAHRARELNASVVVFLDADVIPAPGTIEAYSRSIVDADDTVGIGPVAYLSSSSDPDGTFDDLFGEGTIQPGRPRADASPETLDRWDLFWSLSFATSVDTYERIGGFDETYVGYGGEDTDFGRRAHVAGCRLITVPDATGVHQWHPVSDPPSEHLTAIARNARRFHERWSEWPMEGWLRRFAADGLIDWQPDGTHLEVVRR